jgi:membrane protein DedA with SNARE-associated domain
MIESILQFIRDHQVWAAPIVLLLAFGESLAFVSLLLPATAILFAIGPALGASGIPFWPVWAAAAVGAFLGDWVSFWAGKYFKEDVAKIWPLSRNPELLPRGQRFFERWGFWGVFFGRFLGPLRAAVPLVAGMCGMPNLWFQVANAASALAWATGILIPGAFAGALFL